MVVVPVFLYIVRIQKIIINKGDSIMTHTELINNGQKINHQEEYAKFLEKIDKKIKRIRIRSCYIDFPALAYAYQSDWFRYDCNELFASISSYLYWKQVREWQLSGINSNNADDIYRNMDNYLEKPEHVENRIRVAIIKGIRIACRMNSDLKRYGYERFLITVIKRTEGGFYDIFQAESVLEEIASMYKEYTLENIQDKRWF